jgi:hypothetical protein
MASHLVNTVHDTERHAMLDAAARHLAPDGLLIAEQYPPTWFDEISDPSGGHIGDVLAELTEVHRNADVVSATIRYRLDDELWTQTFGALRLDDDDLAHELHRAGLAFDRWLREDKSWFAARRRG